MARRVRITWEKIRVHKSENYGGFLGVGGEPGKSAEWLLFFEVHVNGQQRTSVTFDKRGIRDGSTHRIDRQMDVVADGPLSIRLHGLEQDETSGGDRLPAIKRSLDPEPGWDQGGSRYQISKSRADYDYTVHYKVEYLDPPPTTTITPGRGVLIDDRP